MTFQAVLSAVGVVDGPEGIGETAASLTAQHDSRWEWNVVVRASAQVRADVVAVIAAEPRIRVFDGSSLEWAQALALGVDVASGAHVMYLAAGDTLVPELVGVIRDRAADGGWLYTDEGTPFADGAGVADWLKPDFAPELLRSVPYAARSAALPGSVITEVGGVDPAAGSAAWYDLVLRVSEQCTMPEHVAGHFYLRPPLLRPLPPPWLDGTPADRCRAVARHCARVGIAVTEVEPVLIQGRDLGQRVRRRLEGWPSVSVVIPSRGDASITHGFLRRHLVELVGALWTADRYPGLEIVVVYDEATPTAVLDDLRGITGGQIELVPFVGEFNFSAKCNVGALASQGEYLCFLNDDMDLITRDWLTEMVSLLADPTVGAVGAKLLFADGTLQHAGHRYDVDPGHYFLGYARDTTAGGGLAQLTGERSGVTAACLLLRSSDFLDIGGFSEAFPLNFNDVDLCLKLRAAGFRIIYTPHAELYHYESQTRVSRITSAERELLLRRWAGPLREDPYVNELTRVPDGPMDFH